MLRLHVGRSHAPQHRIIDPENLNSDHASHSAALACLLTVRTVWTCWKGSGRKASVASNVVTIILAERIKYPDKDIVLSESYWLIRSSSHVPHSVTCCHVRRVVAHTIGADLALYYTFELFQGGSLDRVNNCSFPLCLLQKKLSPASCPSLLSEFKTERGEFKTERAESRCSTIPNIL